jgi:hypothetical protein
MYQVRRRPLCRGMTTGRLLAAKLPSLRSGAGDRAARAADEALYAIGLRPWLLAVIGVQREEIS